MRLENAHRQRKPRLANMEGRWYLPAPRGRGAAADAARKQAIASISRKGSFLFSRWSIRNKLLLGLGLMLTIVVALSWSGLNGLYAYRGLLTDLERVNELPLAAELNFRVNDLRVAALNEPLELDDLPAGSGAAAAGARLAREEFRQKLLAVQETLAHYCHQLEQGEEASPLGDSRQERQTADYMQSVLSALSELSREENWGKDAQTVPDRLQELQALVNGLPEFLQENMHELPAEVRDTYRRHIAAAWLTSVATIVLLGVIAFVTYQWIFRPLRLLIKGSRKVAAGRFDYRISLASRDEMTELADAMNGMAARFQTIRDDLEGQVHERTRQVVRSEQLASVGFLAAGVAHEINEPLARIADCAAWLQIRLDEPAAGQTDSDAMIGRLRQIQDEAFRCKEITTNLLDFSRMGDAERRPVDVRELARGMVEMVRHVGRYQDKNIQLLPGEAVVAPANTQQMKQVLLNLLSLSLESIDRGGRVTVELRTAGEEVEILVTDNGRGLTKAELASLFEPCNPRRSGQGTGLGLAVSARIIKDHGGCITAASAGPGRGAQFRVCLPKARKEQLVGE
jgi:signal transduction histidine kinase